MKLAAGINLTSVQGDGLHLPSVRVMAVSPFGEEDAAMLGLAPLTVGTSPDCGLTVRDPAVSRRHCELTLTVRGVQLRDLGSKNGTFVGELRVGEALLPPGTDIRIGTTRLSIKIAGPPALIPLSGAAVFGEAIGASPPMRALFARLERAAAGHDPVLLVGEPGTGKDLLARALHEAGPRRGGPFVMLDCRARAPGLLEDELFGREAGARPGSPDACAGALELAHGGTLLLEEVGELPMELQSRLVRALESRQSLRLGAAEARFFDARIVASASRDPRSQVNEGSFRADLHQRLSAVDARVPALRDRKEDIPALVARFLAAQVPPRALADLPPNALELLSAHAWPGNVRELQNVVARLVLLPEEVPTAVSVESAGSRLPAGGSAAPADRLMALPLGEARALVVEEFERRFLAAKLREAQGSVGLAAVKVGISRQLLQHLMERYGLRGDP